MHTIRFYDVSISQSNAKWNGMVLSVNDVIRHRQQVNPELFQSAEILTNLESYDFDPLAIVKTSRWDRALKTALYCVSEQIPAHHELVRGRQIIQQLPRDFKIKFVDRRFVLCFLPYLLTGFKVHLDGNFQEDSNSIDEVVRFITSVYILQKPIVTSLLCAHRGFSNPGVHRLIQAVDKQKICRTLNLQLGIFANLFDSRHVQVNWYQQGPSDFASSNMFPEMFVQYMERGEILDLLLLLDNHFTGLKNIFSEYQSEHVKLELLNLDCLTRQALGYMDDAFGLNWKENPCAKTNTYQALMTIAENLAMPEVLRYADPCLKHSGEESTRLKHLRVNAGKLIQCHASGSVANESWTSTIIGAIDWFYQNASLKPLTRALFESAIFCEWGKTCSIDQNRISVGISRDHGAFQRAAWSLGYGNNNEKTLLFARRNPNEVPGGLLKDISFRQFWR
ncbi:hypothetical protein A2647_01875 [Candidatus Nomurabacteria bacterium RIFCSPHIGHO2_01_FULL_40_24b]|nr:MAG: hypothetical protein A2647_01875 [Candidatus Nomurabacteria bacterium RIFCSPHIGHO2_01_FULL_40_24b]